MADPQHAAKATPLSQFNPDVLHDRMVRLGIGWAERNAAADLLEEGKKSVLAQMMGKSGASSVAARECEALQSKFYRDHVADMVEARKQANIARVHYDAAKSWVEMSRSIESTRRAEMTLR